MKRISLSASAEQDLLDIFLQGLWLFGSNQASEYAQTLQARFELLADHPEAGRGRDDLMPGLRTYPIEAHVIVYRRGPGNGVHILRVRHSRENWINDPVGKAS